MQASRRQKKARARPFSPPVAARQMQPAFKVAELVRGLQGFGFTISGQAPCILSCVVPHSSADRAGLHAGDCLLAVNGCDVSRAPHDEVVRLVGSCMGVLRLHLAESGMTTPVQEYSSSDEESDCKPKVPSRSRPPRMRHALRLKRKGATPPNRAERVVRDLQSGALGIPVASFATKHRRRRNSSDESHEQIPNLASSPSLHARANKNVNTAANSTGQLLYRSVVGYLGTIEMPEDSSNQSSPSSGISGGASTPNSANNSAAARLAAIRSCVRRLRIEKKVHTLVLLRVWGPRPGATGGSTSGKITLTSPAGANLARFPARRVVFCGAYADDARFFGLVTSASNSSDSDSGSDAEEKMAKPRQNFAGFTSCHVFMVDSRLVSHEGHAARAHAFRFQCTQAPADGRCLEFPPTAEPILQAVLSLCAASGCHGNNPLGSGLMGWANPLLQQQQQQQQQHNLSSHSSSSSSNSDSGIFRDRDDGKGSDRDVQFRHVPLHNGNLDRLTVRAMPDPFVAVKSPGEVEHAARLRSSMQRFLSQQPQPGMLLVNRNTGTHQHVNPSLLSVRATMTLEEKLSPQVYKARPILAQQNRPVRTPSERNRARSLDDLSRSSQQSEQQLGSDNGLNKLEWDPGFQSVSSQFHWHNVANEGNPTPDTKSETLSNGENDIDNDKADDTKVQQAVSVPMVAALNSECCEKEQQADNHQQQIWTQGFEKLLESPLGLRAFAGFLQKEFSHENIYFWAACERFRRLFPTDDLSMATCLARKIFDRHLGPAAPDPVNVDSQGRQTAEDNLEQPSPELFDHAQKQVFNLMKFDCYPRFLRSAIYRQCVQALQENLPLPLTEQILNDPDLNIDSDLIDDAASLSRSMKLKKSESDAGERRRRSLLPWPKKDRSKSKDRGEAEYRKTSKKKNRTASGSSGGDKEKETTDDDDHHLNRTASKDSVASEFSDRAFNVHSNNNRVPLVRILLPDLSSAVIAARSGQSVQQLIFKLLERRGLSFSFFELFDTRSGTSISVDQDASVLSGTEVRLEPRAAFHLMINGDKMLLVRGQPQRQLGEIIKHILSKYGLKLEHTVILKTSSNDIVHPKTLMASLDGQHLKVSNRDEVSGKIMGDVIKTDMARDEVSCIDVQELPPKSGSNLLGRKVLGRRNSLQADRNKAAAKKLNITSESTAQNSSLSTTNKRLSLHDLSKSSLSAASLMPPPRAPIGVTRRLITQRNPLLRQENEALYERLKRAQRCRLEDQRGTEINFELPDFLKLPRGSNGAYADSLELPIDGRTSEPIFGCRPRLVYQESTELPLDGRASEPIFSRREVVSEPRCQGGPCGTPDFAAIAAQILDKSFSADGLLPTIEQAENYFGTPAVPLDLANDSPSPKITVGAAKQNVATVAARIAAIEQKDKNKAKAKQPPVKSNSNWDDLLLDLEVDWRCYQGRETDDQKQQQLQSQHRPAVRPPLPTPPALELLDLDDPLIATATSPPPLPPKPGKSKTSGQFKALPIQPMAPPRPSSRNVNPARVNVSFV